MVIFMSENEAYRLLFDTEPRLFFYRSIFIGVIRLIKIEVMILSVWKWQFSLKSLLIVIIWSTIETQTGWRGPLIQAHLS